MDFGKLRPEAGGEFIAGFFALGCCGKGIPAAVYVEVTGAGTALQVDSQLA